MAVVAPTAGTLLMVLNHGNAFKSWQWPPKFKAHCGHNDDFTILLQFCYKFATSLLQFWYKFNTSLIPLDKWYSFILKNRNTPSTIFFVADQVPENNKSSIRINFLNQSTLFHLGPEKTSKLLEAEVYYINLTIQKTGFYDVHFQTLKKEDITKSYVNLLEKNIKKQPLYWLWSHRRWKR